MVFYLILCSRYLIFFFAVKHIEEYRRRGSEFEGQNMRISAEDLPVNLKKDPIPRLDLDPNGFT